MLHCFVGSDVCNENSKRQQVVGLCAMSQNHETCWGVGNTSGLVGPGFRLILSVPTFLYLAQCA